MDGETIKRDTLLALENGIDFLSKLPRFRGGELEAKKEEIERSWQELQERWKQVKCVVIENVEVKQKEKINLTETIKQKFQTLPLRRKRSASANEVFGVNSPIYSNLPSEQGSNCSTPKLKAKRSFRLKFNLSTSLTSNSLVPNSGDTIVRKGFGVEPIDTNVFSMSSDGRFELSINGITLQVGNDKSSNQYCCLQSIYLVFGPKLNGEPPRVVINLENCEVLKSKNRKTIMLADGVHTYSITFPHSDDYKIWFSKISQVASLYQEICSEHVQDETYATIPDVAYEISSMGSIDDLATYSYVRSDRSIGNGVCESSYSYVSNVNCRDCLESVERKSSTAEAVTDRGYLNRMKGVDTGRLKDVKSLVNQFSPK